MSQEQVIHLHTYIIGHYNPSVRIIDLFSHTTYIVCVNFIHKCRESTVQSRLRTTDFLKNFSWQFYLLSACFARNLLRGNRRINTFRILFWCLAWGSNPGFSSNKPTYYLLSNDGFSVYKSRPYKIKSWC